VQRYVTLAVREPGRPAQHASQGEGKPFREAVAANVGGQASHLDPAQAEVPEGVIEHRAQRPADDPPALGGGVDPEPDLGGSRASG
jgi:hypothetical protein